LVVHVCALAMDENQTSEPQHSSGFISIRALPLMPNPIVLCVCWRFTNSLQRSARCQRMNPSELSLQALQRAMIVAFGAFQDDQLIRRPSLFCIQREAPRLSWGYMFCLHSVAMAVVDRWSGKLCWAANARGIREST